MFSCVTPHDWCTSWPLKSNPVDNLPSVPINRGVLLITQFRKWFNKMKLILWENMTSKTQYYIWWLCQVLKLFWLTWYAKSPWKSTLNVEAIFNCRFFHASFDGTKYVNFWSVFSRILLKWSWAPRVNVELFRDNII